MADSISPDLPQPSANEKTDQERGPANPSRRSFIKRLLGVATTAVLASTGHRSAPASEPSSATLHTAEAPAEDELAALFKKGIVITAVTDEDGDADQQATSEIQDAEGSIDNPSSLEGGEEPTAPVETGNKGSITSLDERLQKELIDSLLRNKPSNNKPVPEWFKGKTWSDIDWDLRASGYKGALNHDMEEVIKYQETYGAFYATKARMIKELPPNVLDPKTLADHNIRIIGNSQVNMVILSQALQKDDLIRGAWQRAEEIKSGNKKLTPLALNYVLIDSDSLEKSSPVNPDFADVYKNAIAGFLDRQTAKMKVRGLFAPIYGDVNGRPGIKMNIYLAVGGERKPKPSQSFSGSKERGTVHALKHETQHGKYFVTEFISSSGKNLSYLDEKKVDEEATKTRINDLMQALSGDFSGSYYVFITSEGNTYARQGQQNLLI